MSSELISPVVVLPAAASRSQMNLLKVALGKLCQLSLWVSSAPRDSTPLAPCRCGSVHTSLHKIAGGTSPSKVFLSLNLRHLFFSLFFQLVSLLKFPKGETKKQALRTGVCVLPMGDERGIKQPGIQGSWDIKGDRNVSQETILIFMEQRSRAPKIPFWFNRVDYVECWLLVKISLGALKKKK